MSGLLAMALSLAGTVYAAWPWLRRRLWRPPAAAVAVRQDEDMEDCVNALLNWSLAADEFEVETRTGVRSAPTVDVDDE